tara:strand:+ start:7917 stop:10358 length:2442 start_codon:yes stop_codon:yes gene_type:complete
MTKFYPQPPTKWTTALENIYAKQSTQLERHHEQLRQRDQQMVRKAENESLANTFSALAQFSSTIGKAVQAGKARKAEKEAEEAQLFKTKSSNIHRKASDVGEEKKFWGLTVPEYLKEKKNLFKDTKAWHEFIENKSGFSTELKDFYKKLSPREIVLAQEHAGFLKIKTLNEDQFRLYLSTQKNGLANHKALGSNEERATEFRTWQLKELAPWKNSDGLIGANLLKELDRQASTKEGTDKAITNTAINSGEAIKFKARITEYTTLGDDNLVQGNAANFFAEEVQLLALTFEDLSSEGGPTATQQAKDKLVPLLAELAFTDELDIPKLLGGELKGHSAGKTLQQALLTVPEYNQLMTAWDAAGNIRYNKFVAEKEELADSYLVNLTDGKYKTQDEYDTLIAPLEGVVSDTKWEELSGKNVLANTPEVYKKEKTQWDIKRNNGTLLTDDNKALAKKIDNSTLKTEITQEQDRLEESYSTQVIPFLSYDERVQGHGGNVINVTGKGTLNEKGLASDPFKRQLQYIFANFEAKAYAAILAKEPDATDITTRVSVLLEAEKTKNGYYEPAGGPGIWTKDSASGLSNLERSITNESTLKDNKTSWSNNIWNFWGQTNDPNIPGETRVDKLLNIRNAVLTPEKILDNLQNGITSELLYKTTMIPGKNETEVLQAIGKALLNDPEQKAFVQQNGIKKLLENIPTAQIELKKLVKESGDADLIAIDNIGLANASPKQQARYNNKLNILKSQKTSEKSRDDAQLEEQRNKRQAELEAEKERIEKDKARDEKRNEFIDSSAGLSSAIQQGANLINNISPSTDFIQ